MKPPISPAQIRYVLERQGQTTTIEGNILRDHIRAVAAEMRQESKRLNDLALVSDDADLLMPQAILLGRLADKLEGVE